ncbi:3-oxo-5-alpha-steroid 4-dehydrogenase domain-containing protein [Ditylenchus destructor]|uniref:very-long-chain enoyl-CoA reductase n=1 Tax=Ditylenchus destructor TaxID=166010 RepID=A0AAD4R3B7_9BILA|nr:3-oxo-5-alpha-steroid 4-dehydrogenase domain-containing protein [Ditylenchus destructor]
MANFNIEVFDAKKPTRSPIIVEDVSSSDSVLAVKEKLGRKKHLGVERIALRVEPRGKALKDEDVLSTLNLPTTNAQLYWKDLGPQIAWKTVFMMEYAGPLFVYPIFYLRPWLIYGDAANRPVAHAVTVALICHSLHYMKRLYETQFVHRFSHGTMPIGNLFKNCTYYWGFAAFISYFINHPLYQVPSFGYAQVYFGLAGFLISELGNYSIHILLRDLRPPGSKERKIPYPNSNPLTLLFNYVSCPNYSYEVYSWVFFSIMTQSLPAVSFTLLGFAQMKVWAAGKHRNYKKEFPNYPKSRMPIIPFLC